MRTEIRKITPALAEDLLKLNKNNRKIREATILSYSKEMKRGNWQLTGEAIKISKTKRLLDGQHRLHAIIKSGATIEMLVISELPDEIFNVLDTGSLRNAKDVLSIIGVDNPGLTSSISKFIINFNNGKYYTGTTKNESPTNKDIQTFYEQNPELTEIVKWTQENTKKFRLLTPSMVGGMYYVLSKKNITDADTFFGRLIYGLDLKAECSVRLLRDKLIRDSINKSKLPTKEKVNLIITAWNHFRKGKDLKQLKSVKSGVRVAVL
jgi:hypothetical protein